jgi:hypothetical protein
MSNRVAYTLAVIFLVSPLVLVPGSYLYQLHRAHQVQAQIDAAIAQAQIDARASQNH